MQDFTIALLGPKTYTLVNRIRNSVLNKLAISKFGLFESKRIQTSNFQIRFIRKQADTVLPINFNVIFRGLRTLLLLILEVISTPKFFFLLYKSCNRSTYRYYTAILYAALVMITFNVLGVGGFLRLLLFTENRDSPFVIQRYDGIPGNLERWK